MSQLSTAVLALISPKALTHISRHTESNVLTIFQRGIYAAERILRYNAGWNQSDRGMFT